MVKANEDIRKEIRGAGLTLWQVAHAWKNINEVSMVRRLRFELSAREKAEIRQVIKRLTKGSKNTC